MTVVAWDGRTLAADKASNFSGFLATATKIYRLPCGGLVGFAGDADKAMMMLEWFKRGRQIEEFPECNKTDPTSCLFISSDGTVYRYDGLPRTMLIENHFYAMGCGRDYALAAMHLGYDARRAVEVACALDANCGVGIDSLELQR